ncbi:hypothetical protein CsSME_00051592 [Camellia sinensis var. sinensis]
MTNVSCGNLRKSHGTPGLKTKSRDALPKHLSLKTGHRGPPKILLQSREGPPEKARGTPPTPRETPMQVVETYGTSAGLPV